jgi:hypothetical protein
VHLLPILVVFAQIDTLQCSTPNVQNQSAIIQQLQLQHLLVKPIDRKVVPPVIQHIPVLQSPAVAVQSVPFLNIQPPYVVPSTSRPPLPPGRSGRYKVSGGKAYFYPDR